MRARASDETWAHSRREPRPSATSAPCSFSNTKANQKHRATGESKTPKQHSTSIEHRTSNIEHRTSNVQHPTSKEKIARPRSSGSVRGVQHWKLDVRST